MQLAKIYFIYITLDITKCHYAVIWAVKQANRCCERRAPVCMQRFLFHYMAFLHFLQTPNTNDILKVFRMWLLACVLWFFFIVVVATLFIMYMCVYNPFIKCYYGCFCYCRQRTMDRQASGELCWKQKQAYIYIICIRSYMFSLLLQRKLLHFRDTLSAPSLSAHWANTQHKRKAWKKQNRQRKLRYYGTH